MHSVRRRKKLQWLQMSSLPQGLGGLGEHHGSSAIITVGRFVEQRTVSVLKLLPLRLPSRRIAVPSDPAEGQLNGPGSLLRVRKGLAGLLSPTVFTHVFGAVTFS